jgi:glutathione peroxidase-family protein
MMKKIIFSMIICWPFLLFSQSDVYTISFKDLNNKDVTLGSLRGKRMIVVVTDAYNPDQKQLRSLDTMCNENSNVKVVVVPVTDFSTGISTTALSEVLNQLHNQFVISGISTGRKNGGEKQHPLLKWLTHKQDNQHMDIDIEETGQMYVINEKGIVYAMIKRKISPTGETMKKILIQ